MYATRTPPPVVGPDHPCLVDDLASGSRYRLSLVQGILFYRMFGGIAPVAAVVARHGLTRQVLLIVVLWLVVLTVSVALWRIIHRRHLVQSRLALMGLLVDTVAAVAFNLLTALLIPGSVQDSFGDVFWFLAQVNVAAWTLLRPAVAPVAILGWSGVAGLMLLLDPERPVPVQWLAEVGFIAVHAVWLALAALTLITAGRLIRLGSSHALSDGLHLGRRVAQLQALRDTHDTVLQTLEAIALRASDTTADPAGELRTVGRMARSQAEELRRSLQGSGDDDLRGMMFDLRERFVGRLDIELDFLDSARVVQAPAPVRAALYGAVHECLTNIIKHAGVRQAYVQVDRTSAAVRITVRDYGRGFLPHRTSFGFGLTQSITHRLEEVGGRVDISSAPGDGAVLTLTVPLAPELTQRGWVIVPSTPLPAGR